MVIDGFVLDEDQSEVEMPDAEDWQTVFNGHMRGGWIQGFTSARDFPDMTELDNPYLIDGIVSDELVKQTRALAWEDAFKGYRDGSVESEDDCPYPA